MAVLIPKHQRRVGSIGHGSIFRREIRKVSSRMRRAHGAHPPVSNVVSALPCCAVDLDVVVLLSCEVVLNRLIGTVVIPNQDHELATNHFIESRAYLLRDEVETA